MSTDSANTTRVIVAVGVANIDYVAYVAEFPEPDSKIRTDELVVAPGGNAWNGIAAPTKFGAKTRLVTKIGGDMNGKQIATWIKESGIEDKYVVVNARGTSCFSYVIVDKSKKSRTCIFTLESELLFSKEVSPACLEGADMLYLDGRHAEAAKKILEWALEKNIPVILDAEKDQRKPSELDFLLTNSDYICTNTSFPILKTKKEDLLEGMLDILLLGNKTKFVVTTLGENGCILMERFPQEVTFSTETSINSFAELKSIILARNPSVTLANYPSEAIKHYIFERKQQGGNVKTHTLHCAAYPFQKNQIVDTTGAGDVFIGTVAYGLVNKLSIEKVIKLASFVAGHKCTVGGGAQKGIPFLNQVPQELRN